MKEIILLFILLLISRLYVFPQEFSTKPIKTDTIVGSIISEKPNELSFKSTDGTVWILKNNLVNNPKTISPPTFVQSNIGFLVGNVDNEVKAPMSFLISGHRKFCKSTFFGFGTGLEFSQSTYIPFIFEIRYCAYKQGLSYFLKIGYTTPLEEKIKINGQSYTQSPGNLINPGIAYTFASNEKTAFTVSIGYRYQKTDAKLDTDQPNYYYSYQNNYSLITQLNRFEIRFGYTFW